MSPNSPIRSFAALCILAATLVAQDTAPSRAVTGTPRIRISSGIALGMVETQVKPVFPRGFKGKNGGVVYLKVVIDRAGNVKEVSVIRVNGDPALGDAARDAVAQWKYRPYMLNGEPQEVETKAVVNFSVRK